MRKFSEQLCNALAAIPQKRMVNPVPICPMKIKCLLPAKRDQELFSVLDAKNLQPVRTLLSLPSNIEKHEQKRTTRYTIRTPVNPSTQ
jgi:hypothetical protein